MHTAFKYALSALIHAMYTWLLTNRRNPNPNPFSNFSNRMWLQVHVIVITSTVLQACTHKHLHTDNTWQLQWFLSQLWSWKDSSTKKHYIREAPRHLTAFCKSDSPHPPITSAVNEDCETCPGSGWVGITSTRPVFSRKTWFIELSCACVVVDLVVTRSSKNCYSNNHTVCVVYLTKQLLLCCLYIPWLVHCTCGFWVTSLTRFIELWIHYCILIELWIHSSLH